MKFQQGGLRLQGRHKKSYKGNPLISIITVVYNGEKTIKKTISSVLNQTYKNIEYIIVDGASKDNTVSILKSQNSQIDYWISEVDKGISDAFNKGIELANGEIIGIINADDWYNIEACRTVADNYNKKFDVYFGACNIYNENTLIFTKKSNYSKLSYKMSIYHPTCFITKRAYDLVGVYNCNYKLTMDYDLLIRIHKRGLGYKRLNITIANFQLGGVSNSNKWLGILETKSIKNANGVNNKLINQFHYIIQILYLKVFELRNATF